jgi:hypothetical protein
MISISSEGCRDREGVRKVDELVKLVSQKTGLSEEMSRTAVEIVIGFLKQKLPAPIAGQIDSVLGGAGAPKGVQDLAKGLGGMLGKK